MCVRLIVILHHWIILHSHDVDGVWFPLCCFSAVQVALDKWSRCDASCLTLQRCTSHPRAADSQKKQNNPLSLLAVDSLSLLLLTQVSAQWLRVGEKKYIQNYLKSGFLQSDRSKWLQPTMHCGLRLQTSNLVAASCLTFSQCFFFPFYLRIAVFPSSFQHPASLLSVGTQRPPPTNHHSSPVTMYF